MTRNRCNPCICFCLFSVFIVISFVIYVIIFFSIFSPQELKLTVSDASLTKFDYNSTGNNTLFYNMSLNITIRNKRVGVYYNRIQALSQYGMERFSMVTLTNSTPLYQGHKNTTVVSAFIQGQQVLLYKEKELKKYITETNARVYSIEVKLALRVKVRHGKIKTQYYKPKEKISCRLKAFFSIFIIPLMDQLSSILLCLSILFVTISTL